MTKPIQVALLGYGLSGRVFHLPFLLTNPGFKVKYISSSRKSEVFAIDPDIQVTQDLDLILSDPSISLIINTLPNIYHYDISKKALCDGKHVVVEKPFVNSLDEGLDLIETARKNKLLLTAFHNRRWDGDFLTIKELIDKNTFGEIKLFESRFDRFKPSVSSGWRDQPQAGSGVFFDLAPHLADQAVCLFGYPTHVSADILSQREGAKVDDYFELTLHYKTTRVVLRSSSLICHKTARFEVFGTKRSLVSQALDPQEELLKNQVVPYSEQWLKATSSTTSQISQISDSGKLDQKNISNKAGDYGEFYKRVHAAITSQREPPVASLEALNVIKIIESAFQSSKNHARVEFQPITR